MPETPVKFVDGVGTAIETVDMEVSARDAYTRRHCGHVEWSVVVGHTSVKPFQGHLGIVDIVLPTTNGFTGNTVGDHAIHA